MHQSYGNEHALVDDGKYIRWQLELEVVSQIDQAHDMATRITQREVSTPRIDIENHVTHKTPCIFKEEGSLNFNAQNSIAAQR